MSMQEELLFDLIEYEALVNVFLDKEGFTAKGAAIIVTGSAVGHFPKKRGDHVTLWFGRGISRETFKDKKLAYQHALEILGKLTEPRTIRVEGRDAKKFQKLYNMTQDTSDKRIEEETP